MSRAVVVICVPRMCDPIRPASVPGLIDSAGRFNPLTLACKSRLAANGRIVIEKFVQPNGTAELFIDKISEKSL